MATTKPDPTKFTDPEVGNTLSVIDGGDCLGFSATACDGRGFTTAEVHVYLDNADLDRLEQLIKHIRKQRSI